MLFNMVKETCLDWDFTQVSRFEPRKELYLEKCVRVATRVHNNDKLDLIFATIFNMYLNINL